MTETVQASSLDKARASISAAVLLETGSKTLKAL